MRESENQSRGTLCEKRGDSRCLPSIRLKDKLFLALAGKVPLTTNVIFKVEIDSIAEINGWEVDL